MEEHQRNQTSPIEVDRPPLDHLPLKRGTQRDAIPEAHRSPLRLLIITIVAIFVAEIVAMIVVSNLRLIPYYQITLVDAGLMTILIFPALYLFSFRPLIRQIEKSWQAEESLLQSRELQKKFFDSINTMIAYMDCEFNFIRVNSTYAKANGHQPEYFIGKNHFALYPHPENQAIFKQVVDSGEAFLAYEKPFEFPEHPELGVTYWDWSLQPVKGSKGNVEGVVLSLLDVTEPRRAQDAIRQLSRIVEQTEDTVVVTNCDGVIEYVNPAFERLTGYTEQEILGKTPRVLKSGVHESPFYQKMWKTILNGEVFQNEIANRKKNGELFYEVKTVTPLRDSQGHITHFVATGKDITLHKHDEEELHKAYEELELRVEKRTEELRIANSELEEEISDRKRAEQALQRSEALLSQTGEMARVGGWELDIQRMTLLWSQETYRIHEVDPSFQPTVENAINFYTPEARPVISEAVSRAIDEGQSYDLELSFITAKGKNLWVRTIGKPEFREGKCVRLFGVFQDITAGKRADEALRGSEQRLNRSQEIAHLGSWELDLQDNRLTWSDEVYRIFGLQPQEFGASYEDFLDVVHPDDRAAVDNAYTSSVRNGKDGYEIEHRVIRKCSGEVRIVYEKCEHFRNESGQIIRSVGMVHDITERKEADEALRLARDELELRVQERTEELAIVNRNLLKEIAERREIERHLRIQTTAMEAAANGIVITDHQGNIQWTNPALTQISGYNTEDLIGHSTKIFNSGQQNTAYYQQMWDTILSGEVWRGEMTNQRKDGSFYVEEQTITPVRGDQDQITQFIAIKQDITERRRAEEALRESEEKFRTLVEWTYDWEIWRDPCGKIVYTSPSCERITGYSPEEFKAAPDLTTRIIHPDDFPIYLEHQRLIHDESAGAAKMQYRILARDGGEHWIEHVCRPLFGADNRYLGRRISNRDITEQKQAEKDIKERNQKEKILTQTIHTMQLDIARDLHDTIGQNISFLRMKLDYLAEKKIRKQAAMQLELQSMARAANESYDLMRGTLAVLQSANSGDLFRLFTRYAEQIEERSSFKIALSNQGEPKFMSAKRMRHLFYVFREILNNIEKHANASQVTIEMVWDRDCLNLVVCDNGSGFDLDKVQYGSHYGLKFMRERVELLNGSLAIHSGDGSGTSITLQAPYE